MYLPHFEAVATAEVQVYAAHFAACHTSFSRPSPDWIPVMLGICDPSADQIEGMSHYGGAADSSLLYVYKIHIDLSSEPKWQRLRAKIHLSVASPRPTVPGQSPTSISSLLPSYTLVETSVYHLTKDIDEVYWVSEGRLRKARWMIGKWSEVETMQPYASFCFRLRRAK